MNNQDLFSGVQIIINDYILLACRNHWDKKPKKQFVAGSAGGVRYADPRKNGPDELQYSHNSPEIVKGMFKHVLKMSVPKSNTIEHFDLLAGGIADHINGHILGAAPINAVKEGIEESGLTCIELDEYFVHEQSNRHGPQYFYLAKKVMKFNGLTGEFECVTDLVDQLPKEGVDYNCLDHDLTHIAAVHIDKVFNHPDIDIIPTHIEPIKGAIAHYKAMQK